MRYEGNIFRPFSEANSYLLQCTIGCSHNKCTFCGMYKDKKYRVRSMEEIKIDIRMAKNYYGDLEKVFLCDGDAIAMDTAEILEILDTLHQTFPALRHIGCYVGPRSVLEKSLSELAALKAAGLGKVYLGVETGDDRLLQQINKGVGATEMLQAGQNLIKAGMNLSSMVVLGLAGPGPRSREHALATAEITNQMQPQYLAALTLTPVPGTVLYRQWKADEFKLLDPFATLEEMKWLLEALGVDGLKFVGTHASNYLPITGALPRDRERMLAQIEQVLTSRDARFIKNEKQRGL